MKGKVLGFNESKAEGVIRGDDENRYRFTKAEFNAEETPTQGVLVDFDIEGGVAKDIFVVQKVRSQGIGLEGVQSKAANAMADISSNADVMKAKETVSTGFSNAPVAVVALLIYGVAIFTPYISLHYNWLINFELSLIDTTLGKVAFVLVALLLVTIMTDVIKKKKKVKVLGALALLVLPALAILIETSSLSASLGSRVNVDDLYRAFGEKGSMGVGSYLMGLSALVLLFSPIKKQGNAK